MVSEHAKWMTLALELAEKGRGFTSPNPVVGACVVRAGRLISSGYHTRFGAPHAEVEAIRKAGRKARGSDLYVTLEPCSTFGKTPPCVPLIAEAGIARVIIGTRDPNPKHKGRGISDLRKNGIRVTTGILREEIDKQIEAFRKWVRTGIPFVTLKMAQSLDGKIATAAGESRWISGAQARAWVHELRACHDAVLAGKNTVLRDDPRLTARPIRDPDWGNGRFRKDPWRIALDERGAISPSARIFGEGGPTILACSERWFHRAARKFRNTRVTLIPVRSHRGRLDVKELLSKLGSLGITSLLIEGGGEAAWSFLEEGLVDKLAWIVAPKIIGGRQAKTSVEGTGIRKLNRAIPIRSVQVTPLGTDFLMEGYLR